MSRRWVNVVVVVMGFVYQKSMASSLSRLWKKCVFSSSEIWVAGGPLAGFDLIEQEEFKLVVILLFTLEVGDVCL